MTSRPDLHTHQLADEVHVLYIPDGSVLNEEPRMRVVGREWDAMRRLIGGFIEILRSELMPELPCGCLMVMVVDEEGAIRNRVPNPVASRLVSRVVVGDVFLVGEGLVGTKKDHHIDFFSLPQAFNEWKPGDPVPGSTAQPWEEVDAENKS